MAFTHGKDLDIYANGYILTDYLDTVDGTATCDVADVTTFGCAQKKYIPGVKDGTATMEGFYDGDSTAAETVLQSALGNTAIITWYPSGDAVASFGYGMDADGTAFAVNSTLDNASRINAAAQSSTGLEPLVSLHAMGTEYSATYTGTAFDYSAAATSGGSAYIQVVSAAGSAAVSIYHSPYSLFTADNTELVAFTGVSGRTAERVTFTGSVKQYVRVVAVLTGSETLQFNVGIHRKFD